MHVVCTEGQWPTWFGPASIIVKPECLYIEVLLKVDFFSYNRATWRATRVIPSY